MNKKLTWKSKVLAAALTVTMSLNLGALSLNTVLAAGGDGGIQPAGTDPPKIESLSQDTSLEDVKIPVVSENPYEQTLNYKYYPVYNDDGFNFFRGDRGGWVFSYDLLTDIGVHSRKPDNASPYYTAALTPKFTYYARGDAEITSNLPYREGKENMLHSELTLKNGMMNSVLRGENDFLTSEIQDYQMNGEQIYLRVGATLISGSGRIWAYSGTLYDEQYTKIEHVSNGEPKEFWVDVPLKYVSEYFQFSFDAQDYYGRSGGADCIMTNFFVTLIDNTNPSVTDITVEKQMRENNLADMVMTMTFNEHLRLTSTESKGAVRDTWVELELQDLVTGKKSTLRLYLETMDGNKLTFRGDMGLYHYRNFRVNRISKVNFGSDRQWPLRMMVDLADEFYVSAYEVKHYNNALIEISSIENTRQLRFNTTHISDYASNPINASSIVNWQFGNQSFISNSFETVDVQLYTEQTLRKVQQTEAGDKADEADISDQFIGPSRTLIAYLYLDQILTEDEASKVWIELNVLDKEGNRIKAYATSRSEYSNDEVYANGNVKGTLLKFENIRFSQDMTIESVDGEDPVVRIVKMGDDIDGKEAFPNVEASNTDVYADFDRPWITLGKFAATESDAAADEKPEYYKVSVSIGIKDESKFSRNAGVLGTKLKVNVGGGVDKDTPFRYVLSDSAVPPESADGYTSSGTLHKEGRWYCGDKTLLNTETEIYLHMMLDADEMLLDGLTIDATAEDVVGNQAITVPSQNVDYMIDTMPPALSFDGKAAEVIDNNTNIKVYVNMSASDINDIVQLLYSWGVDPDEPDFSAPEFETEKPEWTPVQIERGKNVSATIERVLGDGTGATDKIYDETLYVKAIDKFGNESDIVSVNVAASLEKPATDYTFTGDINAVSRNHGLTVKGPAVSAFDGSTAYTRVSITPIGSEYSYVTVVATGEEVNPFDFEGMSWYKVKREGDVFAEVHGPETIGPDFSLSESSIMHGLLTYYGDVKVTFENGYESMTPVQGSAVSAGANAASYFSEPNYLNLRFASPYDDADREIHRVDFGEIIDRDDLTVVKDADKGNDPYKYNADQKGVNPMRNTQIHFSITNVIRPDYGMLDLDFAGSYAELYRVGEGEEEDVLVARRDGLAVSDGQYFTIDNFTDDGEAFITGAYYLKVTVKSNGDQYDVYESSRLVLDAETAENAGLWGYSTQGYTTIESIVNGTYSWQSYTAEDKPFESIGVAVSADGELMRSRIFAVYSYGVTGLSVTLKAPGNQKTYEGLEVGGIEGYRIWNLLSEPTDEEIQANGFAKSYGGDHLSKTAGLDTIYSSENIPKGAAGFDDLYFVKGMNTFCYQVKMENGYVSPIKQFTVYVSDYAPELNIAVENYQPSHETSQIEGVINASYVRFLVETAYSLNGSGNVDVDVWTKYGMNVGIHDEEGGNYERVFAEDPTPGYVDDLSVMEIPGGHRLKVGDYVDFTENSYTAEIYKSKLSWCTALFVARDEYGAITIVAPQIGAQARLENIDGDYTFDGKLVHSSDELNIDYYGQYYADLYTPGESFTSWRKQYNVPQYFGARLLGFESYLIHNDDGDESVADVIDTAGVDLLHNLFNINTNDITWGISRRVYDSFDNCWMVKYDSGENYELIRWDDAKITFSGGDLAEPVTLSLAGEKNTIGYIEGYVWNGDLNISVAYPEATEINPVGTKVTRQYKISCYNIYGEYFETEGVVELEYIDYGLSVDMKNYGAEVRFSFITQEYGSYARTGHFSTVSDKIKVTDYYGNVHELDYTVNTNFDDGTSITFSEYRDTPGPITVTISRMGARIYVDVTDHAIMSVKDNGSSTVTVTLTKNTDFSYRYLTYEDEEKMYTLTVDVIRELDAKLAWDYYTKSAEDNEWGEKEEVRYRYGEVTVYLVDDNFTLVDKYTGKTPSFTFVPGGPKTYVFKAEDIKAILGEYEMELDRDIVASLDIELYPIPDPLGLNVEDTETPSVQVLAYTNQGGYYSESKLALQLESARGFSALKDHIGYKAFEFTGSRANASQLIKAVGWSTSYRFAVETVDTSRVKLFVKEGLYAEAPDYNTGVSDIIDGVELNSKLLTVTKNAQFTLFAVDSKNYAASIAFDINNLGEAPVPEIVKVEMSNSLIRAYVIPPDGVSDFKLVGVPDAKQDLDVGSKYFEKYYVEYKANDNYIINYSLKYNDVDVSGAVNVAVTEVNLREIGMTQDGIVWSSNKAAEATAQNVSATVTFTEELKDVKIAGEYDEKILSFFISGNLLILTYKDNHPAVEVYCYSSNGSKVTVRFDAVTNVDRTAPIIKEVGRELAPDGKSLMLTLSSSERALFKEGGFIGDEGTDAEGAAVYLYTRKITANGTYTYTFIDMSGIIVTAKVEINELVTDDLEVQYSTSVDGSDPQGDPSKLDLMIGDKVYVKPNRDAIAEMAGDVSVELKSGAWTEIVIPDSLGGILPYVVITDAYGNVLTHQFSLVKVPDITAPEVVVNKKTYSVRVGTDRAQIESKLMANFNGFDDSGEVTLSVKFTENVDIIGITEVEYTATDSAGNKTTVKEKLRITSIYEPEVTCGDQKLARGDGIILSADGEIVLGIDCNGAAYMVKIKAGIRTEAQMKDGDTVTDYTKEGTLSLGQLQKGIYTVCIITQERDYFKILISVE